MSEEEDAMTDASDGNSDAWNRFEQIVLVQRHVNAPRPPALPSFWGVSLLRSPYMYIVAKKHHTHMHLAGFQQLHVLGTLLYLLSISIASLPTKDDAMHVARGRGSVLLWRHCDSYVHSVLRMTSYFHTTGHIGRRMGRSLIQNLIRTRRTRIRTALDFWS